jgi:hypothetical protein
MATASALVQISGGHKTFRVTAYGDTKANAEAVLIAKMKLIPGTVIKAESSDLMETTPVPHIASTFEDASIVISRGNAYKQHTIRINNLSLAYESAFVKGAVDVLNADIIAMVTAFIDSDGISGYSPVSGTYSS